MKRLFASFLSLSLLAAACTVSQPQTDTPTDTLPSATPAAPTPVPDPMQIPWDDRSIFKSGLITSEQHVLDELNGASVYHIEFTLADNLNAKTGTEEIRYTNKEDVELNEVHFRLFPNILGGEMTVSNLTINDQPVTPEYDLNDSLMIVRLPAPLEIGQSIVFKMDYSVTVPRSLQLNYGVLAYANEVLALAHAYPVIAVYDDEGWNAEIPPQDGDVAYQDVAFYIVQIRAPK
ncbi:MAG TPA: hypothetical protein VK851_00925, partial [Anaerolineales bacterium]|nr:hypothetical protein [Anaerolineales bacterium]